MALENGVMKDTLKSHYAQDCAHSSAPMAPVARMIRRHFPALQVSMRHRVTIAATEGFNSRIQAIKAAARRKLQDTNTLLPWTLRPDSRESTH